MHISQFEIEIFWEDYCTAVLLVITQVLRLECPFKSCCVGNGCSILEDGWMIEVQDEVAYEMHWCVVY